MNSKQATISGTYAAVSPPRTISFPPGPLLRDTEITGSGGDPTCGNISSIILQITTANHDAQVSAVCIQSVRNGLRALSQNCRWLHAKFLRIHPSTAKLQYYNPITRNNDTK